MLLQIKKKRLRTAELVHKVESCAHCVCFLLCTGCKYIIYMLLMFTLAFTVAYSVKEYIFLFNKIVYNYKRNVFYYNYTYIIYTHIIYVTY